METAAGDVERREDNRSLNYPWRKCIDAFFFVCHGESNRQRVKIESCGRCGDYCADAYNQYWRERK